MHTLFQALGRSSNAFARMLARLFRRARSRQGRAFGGARTWPAYRAAAAMAAASVAAENGATAHELMAISVG
jgi:hypothetical protein